MNATAIRRRIGTCGLLIILMLLLMPAGALTFGVRSEALASPIGTASGAAPWSRRTFDKIRVDRTTPSTQPAARVQLAAPPVQVPGTVQNLRRADSR
jgi:hypothetical protein